MPPAAPEPADDRFAARLLALVDSDQLLASDPHPCPYLPGRTSRIRAFRAPQIPAGLYERLMDRGFRRNGEVFYTTACEGCRRCIPLRVPVATFRPTRSQRRAWRRNGDVDLRVARPAITPEKWDLYRRYLQAQHGSTEGGDDPASFAASLYAESVDTYEATYWIGERLVAVTVLDVGPTSVSSVYHWFEPAEARRSLGVFSVLAEIDWTRSLGRAHYQLGYWIEGCATMAYKANYGPHELLLDGRWQPSPG